MLSRALPFILLSAIALAAAFFLLPPRPVLLKGELSEMLPEAALLQLREGRAAGTVPAGIEFDVLQAKLERGARNWDGARRLYETALREPDTPAPQILDQLADTALLQGDAVAATDYLRRAHELDPTPDRRVRLGRRLAAAGDTAAEIKLLSQPPLEMLDPEERARLTDLLFIEGDADRLESFLKGYAGLDTEDAVRPRADLLAHFAATGREAQLLPLYRGWPGEEKIDALISALVNAGARDIASMIAVDVVTRRPEFGAAIVSSFTGPHIVGAGVRPVAAWLSSAEELSDSDWSALVAFALRSGDLKGLHRALQTFRPAPPEAFVAVLRYEGPQGLVAYRRLIASEHEAQNPLLAAGLAAADGDGQRTAARLAEAGGQDLTDWDKQVWANLVRGLSGTPWQAELLRRDLPPDMAQLAAGAAQQTIRVPMAPEPEDKDG